MASQPTFFLQRSCNKQLKKCTKNPRRMSYIDDGVDKIPHVSRLPRLVENKLVTRLPYVRCCTAATKLCPEISSTAVELVDTEESVSLTLGFTVDSEELLSCLVVGFTEFFFASTYTAFRDTSSIPGSVILSKAIIKKRFSFLTQSFFSSGCF